MNMMPNSDDQLFGNLLSGYVADSPEDGFSDQILNRIASRRKKRMRLRRSMLAGAFFFGGAIAGSQLSGLIEIVKEMSALDRMTGSDLFLVVVASVFALTVWISLDSRSAGYNL